MPKDLASTGNPCLVVPHLWFGRVPSTVGCDNRFHLKFGEPLHDVVRTPDQLNVVGSAEIVWLEKRIEVVVGFGIIF